MRRTFALAMVMAFGLGLQARAQETAPLTLDALFALSPEEAANRLLGPTPEVFVERAPFNTVVLNYVLNTIGKYQMQFYAQPERIAPSACVVTVASAFLDLGLARRGSDGDGAASSSPLPTPGPVTLLRWDRSREYFAAGPAPATPAKPGGEPITPERAALAKDSCANPVALRGRFSAPSDQVAILLISKTNAAAAAAKRRGPLPFKLHYECPKVDPACGPRRQLAALKKGWIDDVKLDESCQSFERRRLDPGAKRCLSFELYGDPVSDGSSISFDLVLGKSDRLLEVYGWGPHGPMVVF